jgi:hypothetical protein
MLMLPARVWVRAVIDQPGRQWKSLRAMVTNTTAGVVLDIRAELS